MLGNGFDLYHNLLTHYDDFMTIGEYLSGKVSNYDYSDKISIYSELDDLDNKIIKNKLFIYEDAYKNIKIDKREYIDFCYKLYTNCWFKYFLAIKNRNGWVALENQVEEVLMKFRQDDFSDADSFLEMLKIKNNYSNTMLKYISNYMLGTEKNYGYIYEEYIQFVEILRQYLKIFVDSVLPHISNLYIGCNNYLKDNDYVLNFNYTNTYAELYGSKTDVIHIHGKLDNSIVLGVNSNKYDDVGSNDCKFIKYKKYYQRITKRTLDDLNPLFSYLNSTTEKKCLFIIGHSLDVSDGDILTVIFDVFDVINIYFHDDNALDSYVKNLKLIFGAKELSKMTFSQKIIFRKLPPNEFKKVTPNDKL